MTSTDTHRSRPNAVASRDAPWDMSIVPDRVLQVDLDSGVDVATWDALLAAIIGELPNVVGVRFIAPDLTPGEEELLNSLLMVLEKQGLDVEWR
jgi:pyridoxine 5'-phosphate synthase PdxJ